ncbi:MAG: hypothetical protein ACOYXT_27100 [Bacteroidota bacterium]
MKKIILIALLFCSVNTLAQNDGPQKMIDDFFNTYKARGADAALDYIFGTNKWTRDSKDQIDNVKFKLNGTIKLLGEYFGYELITKKTFGQHISLYTFIVRYDRQPLRFTFLYYKPDSEWRFQNFSYDYNFPEELEESSKPYRLKENLAH